MTSAESNKRGGVPAVAVLLTWFMPGAGHLYLGRIPFALGAFAVVQGLYYLGFTLSEGLLLEYLPPEMRSPLAGILTPEFGNLGALLYQMRLPYLENPQAWPELIDVGTTLTAMSGVLNAILMSHAHLAARQGSRPDAAPGIGAPWAALATWAVPGLGQFLQGRRLRGAIIFLALVSLFLVGCVLAQGTNLDRERHFYYWAGQFLLGLPAIVAELVHGHPRVTADVPYADAGVVLGCVAGMLNVMTMLDAYAFSELRQLGESPDGPLGKGSPEAGPVGHSGGNPPGESAEAGA